jgi:2'-hydroxyisoflavone reductase
MRILVLGGTGWLGRAVAEAALADGHEVVCLARGTSGSVVEGAIHLAADRESPRAYAAVTGRRWDGVIELSSEPGYVHEAAAALAGSARRWIYVSSVNVYRSFANVGEDEDAPLLDPLRNDRMRSPDDYGAAKVACERAVLEAYADRAVIARAGLIGGPGDRTARSGYWPWRFAHPSNPEEAVLVPAATLETSMVDVRDLARWLLDAIAADITGCFDAVANRMPLGDHLATARAVAAHRGPIVPASDAWLTAARVAEWMGPRSLPLWLADPDWRGFGARSGARIAAAGLITRSLEETLRDALAWEEGRPAGDLRAAGLTDEEERELLALSPRP